MRKYPGTMNDASVLAAINPNAQGDAGNTLIVLEYRAGRKELALASMRKYPPRANVTAILASLTPNVQDEGGDAPIVVNIRTGVTSAPHQARVTSPRPAPGPYSGSRLIAFMSSRGSTA